MRPGADIEKVIEDKKFVRDTTRYALKGNINSHLKGGVEDKSCQDMGKILGRAANALKMDEDRDSAVTLWDTITSSIRKAWEKTKDWARNL